MTMLIQGCEVCASHFFPPRLLCATCFGNSFRDVEVADGTIEACTTLRHRAGVTANLNVLLALVRLGLGPLVIARLAKPAQAGDVVRLVQMPDGSVLGEAPQ